MSEALWLVGCGLCFVADPWINACRAARLNARRLVSSYVPLVFCEICGNEMLKKERRESWEAQRAVGLLHDTAKVVGILPAISRPPLHEKRPCSNRFGEVREMLEKIKKNTNLSRVHTGSSPQTDGNGTCSLLS